MPQIVIEYREHELAELLRALHRLFIANLPFLLERLHSPDWKFHFMPSERERLLDLMSKLGQAR